MTFVICVGIAYSVGARGFILSRTMGSENFQLQQIKHNPSIKVTVFLLVPFRDSIYFHF